MDERSPGQYPGERDEVYIRSVANCKGSISMARPPVALTRRYVARVVGRSSASALANQKDCLTISMKLKS